MRTSVEAGGMRDTLLQTILTIGINAHLVWGQVPAHLSRNILRHYLRALLFGRHFFFLFILFTAVFPQPRTSATKVLLASQPHFLRPIVGLVSKESILDTPGIVVVVSLGGGCQ